MRSIYFLLVLLTGCMANAQQQVYDLFTFAPPTGWKKSEHQNVLSYLTTDEAARTWARVTLVKSTTSKGSPEKDYESEWTEFAVTPYKVSTQPLETENQVLNGWNLRTGLCKFLNKNDTVAMLVTTFTNNKRCLSILIQSNTTAYGAQIEDFLGSIHLPPASPAGRDDQHTATKPGSGNTDGFEFNTTNFDDGWTSVVKEDWVECTKENIKVLLHYPRAEDNIYFTQHDERMSTFWNLLVAPRYTDLRGYAAPGSNLAESAYFANGLLREKETGKDVWVTLFSKGKSGWIEIITVDRNSFVKEFGIENPHNYFIEWDPLLRLAGMNRFAVGPHDLEGQWTNEFQGSTAYQNIYTGLYTGSTSYASRQNFMFKKNKTYNWELVMANGATGSLMKVDQAKASGNWKLLNNWQIWFSEIERQPKTYNAYFSCVKGGRVLWLQDVSYGSYTAYGKISK